VTHFLGATNQLPDALNFFFKKIYLPVTNLATSRIHVQITNGADGKSEQEYGGGSRKPIRVGTPN